MQQAEHTDTDAPDGWTIKAGDYEEELRAIEDADPERRVHLTHHSDLWRVTAGYATRDPSINQSFAGRTAALEFFHGVLGLFDPPANQWETDAEGFAEAVEADEYAELWLSTGDALITDHEGDGTFNPYVEMAGDHGDAHPTDILDSVASAIEDATGAHVRAIEYDANNDVLVPDMDRPDTDA